MVTAEAVAAKRVLRRPGPEFQSFAGGQAAFMKSLKWSGRMALARSSHRDSSIGFGVEEPRAASARGPGLTSVRFPA